MNVRLVHVALMMIIILAVAQPTSGQQQRQALPTVNFYNKSLHYTNKGMRFITSKEHGGLELLTGMDADQLGCMKAHCHAQTCDDCHLKVIDGKPIYSTDTTTVMQACYRCHGELEKDSRDVHFAKGMKCVQCHTAQEIHGDGVEHNTYMEPGYPVAKCEQCHTSVSTSQSHVVHGGKIACSVCHTAETVTCFNCHIETRLATNRDVQIPLKNMFWLINHDGKVKLANMLSYVYRNKTMITFAPAYFHSTTKKGKNCQDCHDTKIVRGLKKGDFHPVRWEKGELKGVEGVIPVVAGQDWNLIYFDFKDSTWIPLKNPEKPLLNYSGFCSPLTSAQLAKLAVPQRNVQEGAGLTQRIRNVENGLIEFNPGAPDSGVRKSLTLRDRMAFYKVPGVSVAVVRNNAIEWAKGYGVLKAGGNVPVTTESFFQAASTTKLLTAVLVHHFVQKGKLELDRDVNDYLKSWKIPENDFTREKKVTLRHLLTHRAGMPMTNMAYDEKAGNPTIVQVLKGELPAKNKPAVVEFVPGSKSQYSNIGYVVIQRVLEDVAAKPFAHIAEEIVFQPLGMKSSTLQYPLKPEQRAREIMPHDVEGKACPPAMHPSAQAQGGLMTTPSDLALLAAELMRAYQGKSDRILSQKTVRRMFEPGHDLDPRMLGPGFSEGLGVILQGKGRNFAFLHPGENYPGASCWLIGMPDAGTGAVIMTNGAKGNLLALEVISAITNEYSWPKP